jgi:hypothetical protein
MENAFLKKIAIATFATTTAFANIKTILILIIIMTIIFNVFAKKISLGNFVTFAMIRKKNTQIVLIWI